MRILALATYPLRNPIHGGQRRIRALGQLYERLGAQFQTASVYSPHYGASDAEPDDVKLGHSTSELASVPFVEDLQAGEFAARSPSAYSRFVSLVHRTNPTVIALEQPFMFPLIRRLKTEGHFNGPMIYSSQNWEAPLKLSILKKAGIDLELALKIANSIERLEQDVVEASSLIIAVSEHDASIYKRLGPSKTILLAPNGVDSPPEKPVQGDNVLWHFGERRFVVYVGSAYPPNIEGFSRLLAEDGLFFVPPEKRFAICGGLSEGIFKSLSYQRFVHANGERVQFFPNVSDNDLWALKQRAHAFMLPIEFGGGSNLKTAEALVSGKWVVTTTTALRGFERFKSAPGVLVADKPADFRNALIRAFSEPPLKLTRTEQARRLELVWENAFRLSGAEEGLRTFLAGIMSQSPPDTLLAKR